MGLDIYIYFIFTIIFGLFLGFLSAIPIGAVQLEVAKKAINGHLWPAIAIALGSATSDCLYGVLTLFGLSTFLLLREFQISVYVVGICVLSFLLYRSFQEYNHIPHPTDHPLIYKKRLSFLTGFTIAVTNPAIIIWWLIGFRLYMDIGVFTQITVPIKLLFIISGCTGLGGYLIFIAHMLHKIHKTFPEKYLDMMQIALMVLLLGFICYFSYKLYSVIFHYHSAATSFLK